jgi:hypothetical protein
VDTIDALVLSFVDEIEKLIIDKKYLRIGVWRRDFNDSMLLNKGKPVLTELADCLVEGHFGWVEIVRHG